MGIEGGARLVSRPAGVTASFSFSFLHSVLRLPLLVCGSWWLPQGPRGVALGTQLTPFLGRTAPQQRTPMWLLPGLWEFPWEPAWAHLSTATKVTVIPRGRPSSAAHRGLG